MLRLQRAPGSRRYKAQKPGQISRQWLLSVPCIQGLRQRSEGQESGQITPESTHAECTPFVRITRTLCLKPIPDVRKIIFLNSLVGGFYKRVVGNTALVHTPPPKSDLIMRVYMNVGFRKETNPGNQGSVASLASVTHFHIIRKIVMPA